MIYVLSVLVLVGLSYSGPLSGRLECPKCMHVGVKLTNMPAMIADRFNQKFGPFLGQHNNTACVDNTAASEICPAVIGTSVCDSFNIKGTAIGIIAANLPDAGMEISYVVRACGVLMSDTPKCTPILDLIKQKADLFSRLSQVSTQYKTFTYNGHYCQSVDGSTWPIITDSDSGKHTFGKRSSGNSLSLASSLIMMSLVSLRLYE